MTASLIVIGLIVLGLALMAIEVFVIPGFGVIGLLGVAAIGGAGYLAYAQVSPAYSAITIVIGIVAAGVMFWLFPKTKTARSMVLQAQTLGGHARPALAALVQREGIAITVLRPSGAVEIDGEVVDVVTDGQYVEAGTKVRVVRVQGARVVVEPLS